MSSACLMGSPEAMMARMRADGLARVHAACKDTARKVKP